MFCFDDSLEAKRFERDIKKVIHIYGLTTLGHVKEHYGIKPKDIDYCKYIDSRPKFYVTKHKKTYYEYATSHMKKGLGEVHFCVGVNVWFKENDSEGEDNYPIYDMDGNLKEEYKHTDWDPNGLDILAAAIIERSAIDTTNNRNQEWWETVWCHDLFHNEDIDPIVVRNKINENRKEYGSWKVPWDMENPLNDLRTVNTTVVRRADLKRMKNRQDNV